jgi:hypothetical protein
LALNRFEHQGTRFLGPEPSASALNSE